MQCSHGCSWPASAHLQIVCLPGRVGSILSVRTSSKLLLLYTSNKLRLLCTSNKCDTLLLPGDISLGLQGQSSTAGANLCELLQTHAACSGDYALQRL